MSIETTADLRRTLAKTIDGVRNGTVDYKQASAVAALAGKMLVSARLDLDVLKFQSANSTSLTAPAVALMPADKEDTTPVPKRGRPKAA